MRTFLRPTLGGRLMVWAAPKAGMARDEKMFEAHCLTYQELVYLWIGVQLLVIWRFLETGARCYHQANCAI